MGKPAKSPEEILEELKETLREARGVLKDLNQATAAARGLISETAANEIHDGLKPILDTTYKKVQEIAKNWDDRVEEMFHDLAVTVEAMVKRYSAAKPMQELNLREDRHVILGTITEVVTKDAFASGEEARKNARIVDPGRTVTGGEG